MRVIPWAVSLAILIVALIAGKALADRIGSVGKADPPTVDVREERVPEVQRKPGGYLEVSSIRAPGVVVTRTEPGNPWFFDLGTNVSEVRVDAVYRYRIALNGKWTIIRVRDKVYVVAPRVEPVLDVSIDTATLSQRTVVGWARFDRAETEKAALSGLTKNLNARASTPGAIAQQREFARATVAEFVSKWGVEPMNSVPPKNVRVVFEDEPIKSLVGSAFAPADQ